LRTDGRTDIYINWLSAVTDARLKWNNRRNTNLIAKGSKIWENTIKKKGMKKVGEEEEQNV